MQHSEKGATVFSWFFNGAITFSWFFNCLKTLKKDCCCAHHEQICFTDDIVIICTKVPTRSIKLELPEFLKWLSWLSSIEKRQRMSKSSAVVVAQLSWSKEVPWRVFKETSLFANSGQLSNFSKCWYFGKLNGKPSQSLLITVSRLLVFLKS